MEGINAGAPAACNKGQQDADQWPSAIVQQAFIEGTAGSIGISLAFSAAALVLFTGNFWLVISSLSMMCFVIAAMLALFVFLGWTLGAVEALCLSIVVGLSETYALHIGHSYVHASYYDRKGRARSAVGERGGSILGSSTIIIGSMAVLWFGSIHIFVIIGTIMLMTFVWSVVAAMFSLLSFLAMAGPQGHSGDMKYYIKKYVLMQRMEEPHYLYSNSRCEDEHKEELRQLRRTRAYRAGDDQDVEMAEEVKQVAQYLDDDVNDDVQPMDQKQVFVPNDELDFA